jgi:hypothetical protein
MHSSSLPKVYPFQKDSIYWPNIAQKNLPKTSTTSNPYSSFFHALICRTASHHGASPHPRPSAAAKKGKQREKRNHVMKIV